MRSLLRDILTATLLLFALTALVTIVAIPLFHPDRGDLFALSGFLLISGGITMVFGIMAIRLGPPRWMRTFRARLVLMCVLTALLALVNVAFTSALMFLSSHDLGLLAVLLGFSVGMAVLVAFAFSESTTQSLGELLRGVSQMSMGKLDTRVSVKTPDEVGKLAVAFNSMAEQLDESLKRERGLEHSRRDLVSAVSHDIRTPLASIRAMIESIKDGVVKDAETVDRYIDATLKEVENASALVDDLFELSQIDAGVMRLHIENASIADLISDTLVSMLAQAAERGITLTGSAEDSLPMVRMDPARIQRVIYNLVRNAIQHTPSGGTIEVHGRQAEDGVEVKVADTGEGISGPDLAHLFEWTYRADQSRARDGGAGLGLSISKGIVEAHEGRIWAKSEQGKGTSFFFVLPVGQ